MNLGQQLLFFFSALGAFNGFILSCYLLLFKPSKSASSYFLGLLLMALSIRITKSILLYFNRDLALFYVQIGLSGCFLIGPSLYYFIKTALGQLQSTPKSWKWTYIFWLSSIVLIGILLPYASHRETWSYLIKLIYAQWTIYVLLSGWVLKPVWIKLFNPAAKLSPIEKPVLSIYLGNLIISIAFVLAFFGLFKGIYISGALFFSLMLYLNIPLFIHSKKSNLAFLSGQDLHRYANKKIDDAHALILNEKLDRLLTTEQLYKNPDLKLNDLAKKINISGHQLSQLLNDNLGKSFAAYINEYRINEACTLIANDKGIKLEAIGYEVGFNSKSTFYTAFKKHKQTTPTLYKAQLMDTVII